VSQGNLPDADKVSIQISSLTVERDLLSRISTWPWDAATLTGFVSALAAPAALWLLQRGTERLGF
jgi:hypothetical protein